MVHAPKITHNIAFLCCKCSEEEQTICTDLIEHLTRRKWIEITPWNLLILQGKFAREEEPVERQYELLALILP